MNKMLSQQNYFGGYEDEDLFKKHKIYKWVMIALIITQIVWICIILGITASYATSLTGTINLINGNDWFKWICVLSFVNFIGLIFAFWKKRKYKKMIKKKYGKYALKRKKGIKSIYGKIRKQKLDQETIDETEKPTKTKFGRFGSEQQKLE